jgi:hypothetical protein
MALEDCGRAAVELLSPSIVRVFYCHKCQRRLTDADVAAGKAAQILNRTVCAGCADFEIKPPAPAETPSTSTFRITRRTTTRKKSASTGLVAAGAAIAVGVVGVILVMASGGRRAEPPATGEPAPPKAVAKPPSSVKAADSMPEPPRSTGPAVSAERDALARLDVEVERACAAEEYGRALRRLEEEAARPGAVPTRQAVEDRLEALRARVQREFAALKKKAQEARDRGAEEEFVAVAARVSRWGIASLSEEITRVAPAIPKAGLVGHWTFDEQGGPADSSVSNGHAAMLRGGARRAAGRQGQALLLDGIDSFAEVSDFPDITGSVTVAAWIMLAGGGKDFKVAGRQDGRSGGYKLTVYDNNKAEFEIRDAGNRGILNREVAGGTALQPGIWYHVAGVFSDEEDCLRSYVNGALDREMGGVTAPHPRTNGPLIIGREPFDPRVGHWQGRIDELRIYARALQAEEIAALAAAK